MLFSMIRSTFLTVNRILTFEFRNQCIERKKLNEKKVSSNDPNAYASYRVERFV